MPSLRLLSGCFVFCFSSISIAGRLDGAGSVGELGFCKWKYKEKDRSCVARNPFTARVQTQPTLVDPSSLKICNQPPSSFDISASTVLASTFPVDRLGNVVREVPGVIFSRIFPVAFVHPPIVAAVSEDALTSVLDLSVEASQCKWFAQLVGGQNSELVQEPLCHRYGGHQFGEWVGQLGDGRAVLIGEYVNRKNERWELQLKGSGRTPYSRHGDGRAVLRSSVREFLASEAMYALGIPTSRAVSLVISDDKVFRDQFYNGNIIKEKCGVVLRAAKSWFRIGSLEILQRNNEVNNLRLVVDFMIHQFHPDLLQRRDTKYNDFFFRVVNETATLVAMWMNVGFAHDTTAIVPYHINNEEAGVCNTDNFSLLSITIDYGPFGFMEEYNPDFVPNTSDDTGLYRYGNQPNVGFFNLHKLMEAMAPLIDIQRARQDLSKYHDIYNERFLGLFSRKLGLVHTEKDDLMLVKALLWLMEETKADFTMTFRELSDLSLAMMAEYAFPLQSWALPSLVTHKHWQGWLDKYRSRLERQLNDTDEERRRRMREVNPRYVLRNYLAEVAIGKAEIGNYAETAGEKFEVVSDCLNGSTELTIARLMRVLSHPFTEQEEAETLGYASPPPSWAKRLKVSCSS